MRECARIQTFPDTFQFVGTESQKIQQIGNAIPPKFARLIAHQIIESDDNQQFEHTASLVYYDVTKSSAKSPLLKKTCDRLNELLEVSFIQLRMEV